MRKVLLVSALVFMWSCNDSQTTEVEESPQGDTVSEFLQLPDEPTQRIRLNLDEANKLAQLPLDCIETEYPNKLNQVLGNEGDLESPRELHPIFFGCFDWHSSVHGHWALISLLRQFSALDRADQIREYLKTTITPENVRVEVDYFNRPHSDTWERPYGWAWLLQLATELHQWDDPLAEELEETLQPLTDRIVQLF